MLSDVYFPRVNGVSTSIQTFRTELAARGHEVVLIAPGYPRGGADDDAIHRVPSWQVPLDPEDRLMAGRPAKRLLRTLAHGEFDVIHIQTPFRAHYLGVEFGRAFQVPVVETYHTFFEEYLFHYVPLLPREWMRAAARALSRRQAAQVDRLIVPSTAMRDVLAGYGVTTSMEVLPTGIPLERLRGGDGAAFRRSANLVPGHRVMLFVGRVAHEKNLDFLLRAFALAATGCESLRLVVAGEGPALPHLKQFAKALRVADRVRFVGYLDRDGPLIDCYRAADAFVFASRTETQGLVLLEAMALGLPVVALSAMGTRDILTAASGAVTPADDVGDFARAMREVAMDDDLRARMRVASVEAAAAWGAGPIAERLLAVYRSLATLRH